jgi:hypothetical protein
VRRELVEERAHLLGKFYLFVILCLLKYGAILYALGIVYSHVIEQMEDDLRRLRRSLRYRQCYGPNKGS